MKAIFGISKIKPSRNKNVLAIGIFDGVHVGHRALLRQAVMRARALGIGAAVLTFHPHPVHVLHPKHYQPLISSLDYRLQLLEQLGIDQTIVVRFTKKFAALSAEQFIKKYLVKKICPVEIFVGDDFRFGENRGGTIDYFVCAGQQFGFKVNGIQTVKTSAEKVGSTAIRQLIAGGHLSKAEKLLARKVSILGRVVKGDGRGKRLGFPTANIELDGEVLLPPSGVYAAYVTYKKKKYSSMVNIGHCPTFASTKKTLCCEAHIFGFTGNLYNQNILIEFVKKIRNEKLFASSEMLIQQLSQDKKAALKILLSR